MRLSAKILGAGFVVTATALAGCSCCDSNNRRPTSSYTAQGPGPNPTLAAGIRSGGQWSNPTNQTSQNQFAQNGASGQSNVQQTGWSNTAAGYGRSPSYGGNASTNSPAIPVAGQAAGSASPMSGAGGYNTPVTPVGGYGAPTTAGSRPSYGNTAAGTRPSYGNTAAGGYSGSSGFGAGSPTSPTSSATTGGSPMTSPGTSVGSGSYLVPGSSATGSSAGASNPYGSSAPASATGTTTGSSSGSPIGASKGGISD